MEKENQLQDVLLRLKAALGTQHEVMVWFESRQLVVERVVLNLFLPGGTIIVPILGEESDRWAGITERSGLQVVRLGSEWGEGVAGKDLELLLQSMKQEKVVGTILTAHEVSTGVIVDVAPIAEICRKKGLKLVVFAWEIVGVMELALDRWGVDALISGGGNLCFLGVGNQSAWGRVWRSQDVPCEPALCGAIEEFLVNQSSLDYRRIRKTIRESMRALGVELLVKREELASPVFTTIRLPEGVDVDRIIEEFHQEGTNGVIRGKRKESQILRIDHREYQDLKKIQSLCRALGKSLEHQGVACKVQEGIQRAEEVYNGE